MLHSVPTALLYNAIVHQIQSSNINNTMKSITLILITLFSLASCRASDLNRENAKTILSQKFSQPYITDIAFTNTGHEKAEQENFVYPGPILGAASATGFTDKGKSFFKAIINDSGISYAGGQSISLKSKLAEEVISVDGIADLGNGRKLVEFTTSYIFPQNTPPEIKEYFYSGRKAKAIFALYDDGWRLVEQ